MLHKIKYHLINPIKNLIRWFPIIWKDRDYDDYYIWEILKTKLKYQSEYIKNKGIHESADYDAQRMMLCIRLIEKIQDEYYEIEHMNYHKSEYTWEDVEDDYDLKQLNIKHISKHFDDYFAKHRSSVRHVLKNSKHQVFTLKESEFKHRLAMNVAHYNQNKAQTLLFKILDKDIKDWWN